MLSNRYENRVESAAVFAGGGISICGGNGDDRGADCGKGADDCGGCTR